MYSKVRIGIEGLIVESDLYKGWNILIEDNIVNNKNDDSFHLFLFNKTEGYDDIYFNISSILFYIKKNHMNIEWIKDDYDIKKSIPFSEKMFLEKRVRELNGIILSGKYYVGFFIKIFNFYPDYNVDGIKNSFIIDLSLDPNYDLNDDLIQLEFTCRQWVGDYENVEYFLGRYDLEIEWFI